MVASRGVWLGGAVLTALCCAALLNGGPARAQAPASTSGNGELMSCPGDCNGNGRVSVDELVRGVGIALGRGEVETCEATDRNGDSRVTIGELISAVGSALDGCPCPFDFLDERAGEAQACVFVGRWNPGCGGIDLPATFTVLDDLVGVAIVTGGGNPTLNFFAQANSGLEADIVGFTFGEQAEQITGVLQLSDDHRVLTVTPAVDIGVTIEECAFESFEGEMTQIVSTGSEAQAAQRAHELNGDLADR